MTKKGVVMIFPIIISLIILALFMVGFFLIVGTKEVFEGKGKEYVDVSVREVDTLLLNYLRTPIEVDLNKDGVGEELEISDLIIYLMENENEELKEKFDNLTMDTFNPCFPKSQTKGLIKVYDLNTWQLDVYQDNKVKFSLGDCKEFINLYEGYGHGIPPEFYYSSFLELPFDNKIDVVLNVCFEGGDPLC